MLLLYLTLLSITRLEPKASKSLHYSLPRVRDCAAEARPADETAEAEQGQRSVFASGLRPAQQKQGTATKGAERSEAKGACPPAPRYRGGCRGR